MTDIQHNLPNSIDVESLAWGAIERLSDRGFDRIDARHPHIEEHDVREAIDLHANDVEAIELLDSGDKIVVYGAANMVTTGERIARSSRIHPADYAQADLQISWAATISLTVLDVVNSEATVRV